MKTRDIKPANMHSTTRYAYYDDLSRAYERRFYLTGSEDDNRLSQQYQKLRDQNQRI